MKRPSCNPDQERRKRAQRMARSVLAAGIGLALIVLEAQLVVSHALAETAARGFAPALPGLPPGLTRLAQQQSRPVPASPGLAAEREASALYAEAREAMDRGQTARAAKSLDTLLQRYPTAAIATLAGKDLARLTGRPLPDARAPVISTPVTNAPGGLDATAAQQSARLAFDFRSLAGDRIFFADGAFDIGVRAKSALQAQAYWLIMHPTVTATVEGHADDRGPREFNVQVSAKRAEVVRQRLIDLGVPANRVIAIGLGRDRPIASCPDPGCGAQNRRVVTIVTVDKAATLSRERGEAPGPGPGPASSVAQIGPQPGATAGEQNAPGAARPRR